LLSCEKEKREGVGGVETTHPVFRLFHLKGGYWTFAGNSAGNMCPSHAWSAMRQDLSQLTHAQSITQPPLLLQLHTLSIPQGVSFLPGIASAAAFTRSRSIILEINDPLFGFLDCKAYSALNPTEIRQV